MRASPQLPAFQFDNCKSHRRGTLPRGTGARSDMHEIQRQHWLLGTLFMVLITGVVYVNPALGAEPETGDVVVPEEVLTDADRILEGKEIWDANCTYCHGKKAYPGKAPKLKPKLYLPAFVYDRVANGFRGMPGWSETYNPDEIMSVTAFVMSPTFSP